MGIDPGGRLSNVILFFPFTQGATVHSISYAVDGAATVFITFYIPDDFVALVKLVIRLVPNVTGSVTLSKSAEYAGVGEAAQTHLESSSPSFDMTPNQFKITELDVSDVFTSLSPGDQCGLRFNNQSAPVDKMGVVMEYSR